MFAARASRSRSAAARMRVPDTSHLNPETIRHATESCPFCPGNESMTTPELFRMTRDEIPEWTGAKTNHDAPWVVRVINNLFPRIPAELTGNRNESYIVIEDPRHFIDAPRSMSDLMFTGALGGGHFLHLMQADARVMRLALENPNVSLGRDPQEPGARVGRVAAASASADNRIARAVSRGARGGARRTRESSSVARAGRADGAARAGDRSR